MVDKEMKKEILTRDKINFDLMNVFYRDLLASVVAFFVFPSVCGYVVWLFSKILKANINIIYVIGIVAILTVLMLFDNFRFLLKIKKKQFKIVIDDLDGIQEKYYYFSHTDKKDILLFGSYKYEVDKVIKYYKWSEMFCIWNEHVYHSSDPGDEFYLITIGKKETILMVYNCKMFELKGE